MADQQYSESAFIANSSAKCTIIMPPLCPRVFSVSDEWCDPKYPAAFLANGCADYEWHLLGEKYNGQLDLASANVYAAHAGRLVELGVPTFHVEKNLLSAMIHTSPPPSVTWHDIMLPHDAGVFLFPRGSVLSKCGRDWKWISWSKLYHKQIITRVGTFGQKMAVSTTSTEPTLSIISGSLSSCGQFHGGVHAWRNMKNIELPSEFRLVKGSEFDQVDEDHELILGNLSVLCANLFLAMSARPELVSVPGSRNRVMERGQVRYEWTPNWIGRTYRLQRVDNGGTHASPRIHWRRGHFAHQPCGPGGKDRKTIWREPVLVGST